MKTSALLALVQLVVLIGCGGDALPPEREVPGVVVRGPSWSPDGRLVLYDRLVAYGGRPPGIWVRTIDGLDEKFLVEGRNGAWSPKGDEIAFTGNDFMIWCLNLESGALRRLTTSGQNAYPDWSPDGSMIAFDRWYPSREAGIYVADAGGGSVSPIGTLGTGWRDPTWSPDGEWIAFIATGRQGEGVALKMRPDGTDIQTIATVSDRLIYHPDWSVKGKLVVTLVGWGIATIALNGDVDRIPDTGAASGPQAPTWDPAGEYIIYARDSLWIMRDTGKGNSELPYFP